MSGVPVAIIRTRAAASLAALEGWTESNHPPDRFGRDSRPLQHRCFAAAVPTTSVDDPRHRRAVGAGAMANTTLSIRWSWNLRVEAVVADTTAALEAQALLVSTLLGTIVRDGLSSVTLTSATNSSTTEGTYLVGELTFRIYHRLPLVLAP